jgi:hypothetical protein
MEAETAEASGRLFSTLLVRGRRVDAVHLDAVDNVVDLGEVLRGKQAGGWGACRGPATICDARAVFCSPVAKSRSPFVSCRTKVGGAASRRAVLLRGDR